MESKFKSKHCKPETAALTSFRTSKPEVLHLLKFNPERRLMMRTLLTTYIMESVFLKKGCVISLYRIKITMVRTVQTTYARICFNKKVLKNLKSLTLGGNKIKFLPMFPWFRLNSRKFCMDLLI